MKFICIGRNYRNHASEMNAPIPTKPIFFIKPETALLRGNKIYYPTFTNELHFECEILVKICKVGKNIDKRFAHSYYNELSLGLDLTARDLQSECKKNGLPWEIAKGFDFSAPISPIWISKNELNLSEINFNLAINNEIRQVGNSKDMLFSIDDIISYLSKFITLKIGDIIFTGTPEGVGNLNIGDEIKGTMNNKTMFEYQVL